MVAHVALYCITKFRLIMFFQIFFFLLAIQLEIVKKKKGKKSCSDRSAISAAQMQTSLAAGKLAVESCDPASPSDAALNSYSQ